jgi:hypothetical protein
MPTHETQPDREEPKQVSEHDPASDARRGRPPIVLMILIVLLVAGFVVLHLTGVVGPGRH